MIFQHYTVDDFHKHEDLLTKPFNLTNLDTLVKSVDSDLEVQTVNLSNGTWCSIRSTSTAKLTIHGCTFNVRVLNSNIPIPPSSMFYDLKSFINANGLPVVVDVKALQEHLPDETMEYPWAQLRPHARKLYSYWFPQWSTSE